MPLTEDDRETIEAFRTFVEDFLTTDDRYGPAERHDHDDESTLATRFEVAPACWFEVAIRPMIPQIRVGFLTDDRWKSEGMEQAIQDSGDSMGEFVGAGLAEAGLDWNEPPVEHYREGERFFYFATPLAIDELCDLDLTEPRNKTLRILEGYLIAFGPALSFDDEDG